MAIEDLKNSTLPRALSDVVGDVADLFQKEIRLAKAELEANISKKMRAGAWMIAAAGLGLIALLVVVQAAIFAIANYGIALHWSCLIVAGVLGALAVTFYLLGRADAEAEIAPTRAIRQLKQDIAVAKEQLT